MVAAAAGGDAPSPDTAPATPPVASVAPGTAVEPSGQMDVFSWTPKARPLPQAGATATIDGKGNGNGWRSQEKLS